MRKISTIYIVAIIATIQVFAKISKSGIISKYKRLTISFSSIVFKRVISFNFLNAYYPFFIKHPFLLNIFSTCGIGFYNLKTMEQGSEKVNPMKILDNREVIKSLVCAL
jgi:hypothetical protein